jgi:hypothetical protein
LCGLRSSTTSNRTHGPQNSVSKPLFGGPQAAQYVASCSHTTIAALWTEASRHNLHNCHRHQVWENLTNLWSDHARGHATCILHQQFTYPGFYKLYTRSTLPRPSLHPLPLACPSPHLPPHLGRPCASCSTSTAAQDTHTVNGSDSSTSCTQSSSSSSRSEVLQGFEWQSHWWPVQVSAVTDPSKPHAVELLGRQLVLWRDQEGAWHCFEDACPHR